MSTYYYFQELKYDKEFTPDEIVSILSKEENAHMYGADLNVIAAEKNKRDSFEYGESSCDESHPEWGYINEHILSDIENDMEDCEDKVSLINLLDRSLDYGPVVDVYSRKDLIALNTLFVKNKDEFPSAYLDLYLEILKEAIDKNGGMIILAF